MRQCVLTEIILVMVNIIIREHAFRVPYAPFVVLILYFSPFNHHINSVENDCHQFTKKRIECRKSFNSGFKAVK